MFIAAEKNEDGNWRLSGVKTIIAGYLSSMIAARLN